MKPYDDLRWRDLSGLDLRSQTGLLQTLGFNLKTAWPPRERLPGGLDGEPVHAGAGQEPAQAV